MDPPPSAGAAASDPPSPRASPRALSVAGQAIPRVVLGTAALGSVLPDGLASGRARQDALRQLDAMLDAGCVALDTAASYQAGGTERLLGAWMASRRNRDRLFLITKGCHPYPVVRPNRVTPGAIERDLHASLRRLQTERVDLYLLHRDDPSAPLAPILECLDRHRRAGDIAAWGVSNWSLPRIASMDALARSSGVPSLAASSPHFSLVEWTREPSPGSTSVAGDAHRAARAFHQATQLPVLAWSPLGAGLLSTQPGLATRWGAARVFGSPANRARVGRAGQLARKYGATPAQILLAYLFGHPFPVYAIVATRSAGNMRRNLDAAGIALSERELRWLESGEGEP
jgi:aryl-alcohol dehydrogenase-like predicted oxidoreductase